MKQCWMVLFTYVALQKYQHFTSANLNLFIEFSSSDWKKYGCKHKFVNPATYF